MRYHSSTAVPRLRYWLLLLLLAAVVMVHADSDK